MGLLSRRVEEIWLFRKAVFGLPRCFLGAFTKRKVKRPLAIRSQVAFSGGAGNTRASLYPLKFKHLRRLRSSLSATLSATRLDFFASCRDSLGGFALGGRQQRARLRCLLLLAAQP